MCGRKLITDDLHKLREIYGVREGSSPNFAPSYNVAPTQREPIVFLDEERRRALALATWDYDRATLKKRPPFFNAQGEKFRTSTAFADRRCLVPVNGFYEWMEVNKVRQPFVFQRKDRGSFAMGGVWVDWRGPAGEIERTYVELTTAPNELVGEIHARMPLIVDEADWSTWLEGTALDAQMLVRPNPMTDFVRYAVVPLVNSTRNEGPDLLQPAEPVGPDRTLFD